MMRCPFCGYDETQVKDSRSSEGGNAIRRRRICNQCQERFTTFEHVRIKPLQVLKKDGSLEHYNPEKLLQSLRFALQKRPIVSAQLEEIVKHITLQLENRTQDEISAQELGKIAMQHLLKLDKVAYIRFASVYYEFQEIQDFTNFVRDAF